MINKKKEKYYSEYYQKNRDNLEFRAKRNAENKRHTDRIKKEKYLSDELFLKHLVQLKTYAGRQLVNKKPYKKFELSYEDVISIYNRQNGKCFYTGLKFINEKYHPRSITIDRVNNNVHYTLENSVICILAINSAKSIHDYNDLLTLFQGAVDHYPLISKK
jgi:hypothetical protein